MEEGGEDGHCERGGNGRRVGEGQCLVKVQR